MKHIPNAISIYRIAMIPVIAYWIYSENRAMFFMFISINLVSDWLDGFIARRFQWQTKLGASLDSIGDLSTYLMAAIGFYQLEKSFIAEHAFSLSSLISIYCLPILSCLIRFQNIPSFHLYSSKIAAYSSGIFLISYAVWGPIYWIYNVFVFCVVFSELEVFLISLLLKEHRSNIGSIYFLMRQPKNA